jgi:hypothetical protein
MLDVKFGRFNPVVDLVGDGVGFRYIDFMANGYFYLHKGNPARLPCAH